MEDVTKDMEDIRGYLKGASEEMAALYQEVSESLDALDETEQLEVYYTRLLGYAAEGGE